MILQELGNALAPKTGTAHTFFHNFLGQGG